MSYDPKALAGARCGRRYQRDYIAHADSRMESATLECIKFYLDGRIRFEQHCYGEAASCIFTLWAAGMDADGTLHWALPEKGRGYYDEAVLPHRLTGCDADGSLFFDNGRFAWKLADDFSADPAAGYPGWKAFWLRMTHQ
ncbi:MAG: hypothetical protein LKJ90_05890 [Faecalibacterium sp.]|jgi:hypothetical protein|nr:hypothetical protein [Faecalibacterium sp.]